MAEAGVPAAVRRSRAGELLAYVGLSHRADHRATQLSGGEMQRGRHRPGPGESSGAPPCRRADRRARRRDGQEILDLFRRLNADGTTLVVVTRDEHLAANAGRIVHMLDGRIVDGAESGRSVIGTLAFRHLWVRKVRSLFLLLGFALGVGVMVVLLSVGEAMLDQSQDVSLVGGGEVTILPQGIDVEAMRPVGSGECSSRSSAPAFSPGRSWAGPAMPRGCVVAPAIEGEAPLPLCHPVALPAGRGACRW